MGESYVLLKLDPARRDEQVIGELLLRDPALVFVGRRASLCARVRVDQMSWDRRVTLGTTEKPESPGERDADRSFGADTRRTWGCGPGEGA